MFQEELYEIMKKKTLSNSNSIINKVNTKIKLNTNNQQLVGRLQKGKT